MEIQNPSHAGLSYLGNAIDNIVARNEHATAMRQIPKETEQPSAIDKVVSIGSEATCALINPDLSVNEARALASKTLILLNELAQEYQGLRVRFDGIVNKYVAFMLKDGRQTWGAQGPGVDESFADIRIMCTALRLNFSDVWNGLVGKAAGMAALEEAKKNGAIVEHQYKVYGNLMTRCAKGD